MKSVEQYFAGIFDQRQEISRQVQVMNGSALQLHVEVNAAHSLDASSTSDFAAWVVAPQERWLQIGMRESFNLGQVISSKLYFPVT